METEFQKAVGKSVGEVLCDISEFLSLPYPIHPQKQVDLRTLLPELNMAEQLSFALLSEARTQGWETAAAEHFYKHAVGDVIDPNTVTRMLDAFRDPDGDAPSKPAVNALQNALLAALGSQDVITQLEDGAFAVLMPDIGYAQASARMEAVRSHISSSGKAGHLVSQLTKCGK